jgi:uracil-DNA glycosylase family 4
MTTFSIDFSNTNDNSSDVNKYIGANCAKCPLLNQPFVAPFNIETGEILFVGEAPGTSEVLEGIPFVGQSGALLDKVIERVGRNPLLIAKTNACLCRPYRQADGSVTPPLEAIQACSGALEAVLSSYTGQTIVALGNTPMQALDGFSDDEHEGGIMSRRGVWGKAVIEVDEPATHTDDFGVEFVVPYIGSGETTVKVLHYLPTLHPAFVLRSPGYAQTLIDDIDKAYQGHEKKHKFFNTPYKVIEDFETLKSMILELKQVPLVSFDIETSYLQWYETHTKKAANVLCLVFAGTTDLAYIVPDTTLTQPRVLEFLQMFFDVVPVLAHNGKFDVTVCKAKLGLNITLCDDTLLLHYTHQETKGGHGLKELARETFQIEDYEELMLTPIFKANKMNRDNRNYEVLPRETLYKYAAIDAVVTLALYDVLKAKVEIDDQLQSPYRNILVRSSNALGVVELNGIPIDRPYLLKVQKIVTTDVEHLKTKLRDLSGKPTLNPSSPNQVAVVLYDDLKLKLHRQPIKPTSTNTGDECLTILREKLETQTIDAQNFVLTLLEYRRVEKIRNTYVNKLLEIADINDLVHVNYLLHGTETGRLSASDSMHGIPNPEDEYLPDGTKRDPLTMYGAMIRGAFIAPKGYQLVMADYSQAELRCFADETREPFLLNAYNQNLDVHNETVKIMCKPMGFDYDTISQDDHASQKKNIRRLAKNVNFGGLLYLGGASAIAGMTGLPEPTVKLVMDYYYEKLSVARQWQKDQFRFAKKHGYVQNRFGRKRRFILQTYTNIDEIRKASVNAVIQGDASDLTLLSVCQMIEASINVVHTVHDSIIALVPDELVCNTEKKMQAIMEQTGCKHFPSIPWSADIETSWAWYAKRPNLDSIE